MSPEAGSIVLGPTVIRFEVEESEPRVTHIDVYVDGQLIGTTAGPEWTLQWNAPPGLEGARFGAGVYAGDELLQRLSLETSNTAVNDSIQVVAVELYPVVRDRQGRYIKGLERDDFSVFEQGKLVPIEGFEERPSALTVALVVDISQSMETTFDTVRVAAGDFIAALEERDRVRLYAFNHSVERVGSREDRESARAGLSRLRPVGGTALYDALKQVQGDLAGLRGRKAIVLFSDGRDERSLNTLERLLEFCKGNDTVIYAIAAGDTREDRAARADLDALTRQTGGEVHPLQKIRDVSRAFDHILEDLRAQYLISFSPAPDGPEERRLHVTVSDPKYSVRVRRSFRLN